MPGSHARILPRDERGFTAAIGLGFGTLGFVGAVVALVGEILAATGNLPVALSILKSVGGAVRQPRLPFGR